jgi:sirohydrochlorin ferrochelatase
MNTAVVIVDHGSRSHECNRLLEYVVHRFAFRFRDQYGIVLPAHMELAEPSIATSCARCADRGAEQVIVVPLFLGPGKHWQQDIPRLVAAAMKPFPRIPWRLAAPLGDDDLLLDLLDKRARQALKSAPAKVESHEFDEAGAEVAVLR